MAFKVRPITVFRTSFSTFWAQQKPLAIILALPALTFIVAVGVFFALATGLLPFVAMIMAMFLVVVASIYLGLSMQLSWYRHAFGLEEKPLWFRTDLNRHLKMLWATVKAALFAGLPFLIVALVISSLDGNSSDVFWVTIIFLLAALGWACFASLRLSLYLPAVALDEPVTLRHAFAETQGNFWRLFGLAILINLLAIPLNIADRLFAHWIMMDQVSLIGIGAFIIFYLAMTWFIYGMRFASSAEVYRAWLESKSVQQP